MESGFGSVFQPGLQVGPSLAVELISTHARISGSVNLGAYTRLSDLLNFHDEILTLKDGVVLTLTGIATADGAADLDVHLGELTMVMDHSDYVPPPDADAIPMRAHRMLAVTSGHVITATFFIYPDAEPIPYLRAQEPRWIPITDVRVRSLVDSGIKFGARFAVLSRGAVVASAIGA